MPAPANSSIPWSGLLLSLTLWLSGCEIHDVDKAPLEEPAPTTYKEIQRLPSEESIRVDLGTSVDVDTQTFTHEFEEEGWTYRKDSSVVKRTHRIFFRTDLRTYDRVLSVTFEVTSQKPLDTVELPVENERIRIGELDSTIEVTFLEPLVEITKLESSLEWPDSVIFDVGFPNSTAVEAFRMRLLPGVVASVDSSTWPGSLQWEGDTLIWLWLPEAGRMDTWKGNVDFYLNSGLGSKSVPFRLTQSMEGFVGSQYWTQVRGKGQVKLDSREMVLTSNLGIAGAREDSVLAMRSAFQIQGDFLMEVTLRLPGNVDSAYSVALFTSGEETPIFVYVPLIFKEHTVLSEKASGLSLNGFRHNHEAATFSLSHQNQEGHRLPDDITLQLERRAGQYFLRWREIRETRFSLLHSFSHQTEGEAHTLGLPAYLHLMLGNRNTDVASVVIEWESFTLRKGKVVLP